MKASDFVKQKCNSPYNNNNSFLYDFIIYRSFFEKKRTLEEIKEELNKYIDRNEYIDDRLLRFYIYSTYDVFDSKHYTLTETQKRVYQSFISKMGLFNDIVNKKVDDLKDIILNEDRTMASLIAAASLSSKNKDEDRIKAKCFLLYTCVNRYKNLFNKLADSLSNITYTDDLLNLSNNRFGDLKIIPKTKYQKKMLSLFNIKYFKDLNERSFDKLLFVFIEDPDKYFNELSELNPIAYNSMCEKIYAFYDSLNDQRKTVFKYRIKCSLYDEYLSLQEISNMFNSTREWVRQVEVRLLRKMSMLELNVSSVEKLFTYCDAKNMNFLDIESFLEIFPDDVIRKFVVNSLLKNDKSVIKIDLKLNVIYNSKLVDIDYINNYLENNLPILVTRESYNDLSSFQRAYVDTKYRKLKDGMFKKAGAKESDIYLLTIDRVFQNGYRISNDEDYELLAKEMKKTYGIEEVKSQRAIWGLIERKGDLCLCDRGTYNNIKRCPSMSKDLLDKILDYIKNSDSSVYYAELYSKFMTDLLSENINNQFLLKGLIDHSIDASYRTNRDCISYGDKPNKLDLIFKFMREQTSVFSLKDLTFKYPDVSYSVFQGIIAYESNNNGLLILYDKKFVYAKYTNIETIREKLKCRIDELLNQLKSDYITSHKLFACIALSEDNIFEGINFEVDGFNVYSIVRYLYPNDYFFSRPLISKIDKGTTTTITAIHDYLMQFDEFDDEIVSKYVKKMDLSFKWLSSFQELFNYMSSEFLQTDKRKMIKKDIVNIDTYTIEKVDSVINDLLNKYDEFNISDYNGYFIFPSIDDLEWNEYLVIGFINTYLNDKYEICIKDSKNYIRRSNYEL